MTLLPISPLEYITDRDPIPETVLNVSEWYKTETLELTFGEYVGRPNEFVDLHKSDLLYYLGNGWYVDSVISRGSDGNWVSTAYAKAANSGSALSRNRANANSAAASSSGEGTGNVSAQSGGVNVHVSVSGQEMSVNAVSSGGESASTATGTTSGSSETTTQQEGGPYWAAWSKIRLKRRRMQSEAVLQDMITSFTNAYNEGREINDERYDELVALYAIMLSRTEGEANGTPVVDVDADSFAALNDEVKNAMRARMDAATRILDGIPAAELQNARDQIALAIADFKAMYDAAKEAVDGVRKLTIDDFRAMYDAAKDAIDGIKVLTAQDIKDLIDAARASILAALAKFAESVDGLPENWLQSRTDEINRRFDALLAEAKSKMLSSGTYNSTVWPTTASGIERDRQIALNDLVDEIARIKVDVYGKIATITADVEGKALDAPLKLADIQRSLAALEADLFNAGVKLADVQNALAASEARMLDAGMKLADVQDGLAKIELNIAGEKVKLADENVRMADAEVRIAEVGQKLVETEVRIADLLNKQTIGKVELRNTVFKWMLDFMERRDDEYPGLDQLVTIADKLGYADGGMAAPTSS